MSVVGLILIVGFCRLAVCAIGPYMLVYYEEVL